VYAEHKHQYFAVYRYKPSDFVMSSDSNNPTSGGTIHSVTNIIVHERFNSSNWDYDVALVQVRITFNVTIYNEMCIIYCCGNQLYLTLLLCKMQFS